MKFFPFFPISGKRHGVKVRDLDGGYLWGCTLGVPGLNPLGVEKVSYSSRMMEKRIASRIR